MYAKILNSKLGQNWKYFVPIDTLVTVNPFVFDYCQSDNFQTV